MGHRLKLYIYLNCLIAKSEHLFTKIWKLKISVTVYPVSHRSFTDNMSWCGTKDCRYFICLKAEHLTVVLSSFTKPHCFCITEMVIFHYINFLIIDLCLVQLL